MFKKIVISLLLGLLLISNSVNAQDSRLFNSMAFDYPTKPTIEGGVVRANIYKTAITNAANFDITLRPTGVTDKVIGLAFIPTVSGVLYGSTDDTLAQSDSITAQVGGYCRVNEWCIINWPYNTIRLKSSSGSNAIIYGNVIFSINDYNK
ncbi:MAG: hypothetical protein RLY43_229 [Bacteroidota bacterium]|jgi:hypothetical protein